MRGEAPRVVTANVDQLIADIETLIRIEGRRNFWSGLAINAVFFILGLAGGIIVDIAKQSSVWPF
jgi:hypothetical protein